MTVMKSLEILGHRGEPLPNAFYQHEQGTSRLALIFPGLGYNADMPILFLTYRLLLQRGADVLQVRYEYNRQHEFAGLSPEGQYAWMHADASAALDAGLAQGNYEQVILAGKSIGTVAMSTLLEDSRLVQARCLWLTPILTSPYQRQRIRQGGQPGLFVIGTADRYYDPALLDEVVQSVEGVSLLLPGADHILEVPGDPLESARNLVRMLEVEDQFLSTA